jgi:hypothetical protein
VPGGGVTTGGSISSVQGTAAAPANGWTHVALTYDGANLRLYVNGVQVRTSVVTNTIQASTSPLWIGGNSPYGEYFQGVIDEAQVYNRGLTAAEVVTVMNTPLS